MILVDTNVISEMMKPSPSASVMAWLDRQEATQLFIKAIIAAFKHRVLLLMSQLHICMAKSWAKEKD
jgi:toxin FitB